MERRSFLQTTAGLAALALTRGAGGAEAAYKHRLRKAVIVGKPTESVLKPVKDAGFDGVEAGIVSVDDAKRGREAAEKLGLRIHSVMRGWASFNSPKADEVEQGFKVTADALKAGQGYGADAVLLVPCRIGTKAIPAPWEFMVSFDGETGRLRRVVPGDNAPYAEYIAAHDDAVAKSRAAIQRLIPIAAECGVVIAIENVWNNLFVDPRHFAWFVKSFNSPWVRAYLDLANHVKYSPPQKWIHAVGPLLAKCHVKDFKLNPNGHEGRFVDIRDGSIDWPKVRRALDDVGYAGWMTIEGGSLSLTEHSKRLEDIVSGR